MDIPPGRHNVFFRCVLPLRLRILGELLSISTSESGRVEEQDIRSLHLVRFLRIHVVHYQSILDLTVHAGCTTPVAAPHCCPPTSTSSRWSHLELHWPTFDVENSWENNYGNWWHCVSGWCYTSDLCQGEHKLLGPVVSITVHHSHWR